MATKRTEAAAGFSGKAAIGILAGSGQFPFLVARAARERGCPVIVCGFTGNTDPALAREADAFTLLPLGQLDRLIAFLKSHQVSRVCMAGAILKPRDFSFRPDFRALRLLFRLALKGRGDDAVLGALAAELEGEGLAVIRPDDLAPALRGPAGILGQRRPDPDQWRDIRFGWATAKALGALDIGQCVVIKNGVVIAVEAIEGTDAALARAGELAGAGCTLVKTAKPGQDERLDLPSLGAGTVSLLARHSFACLAFEAEKTLFFDLGSSLAAADAAAIAVVGVPTGAEDFFAAHS
ncbi:MAG: UDP-2,3-diacylglucosamine diphosphatase LpxI [Desulfovibrio sp.]|jgi:DUF1009 family protein|nr:UDP-2,3-diacylglucosamine diphosphatase LpxI [Desulfovibrio sp.]